MSNKPLLASALATGLAASLLTSPSFGQNLTTELVAQGFSRPLAMTQPVGDDDRFFVIEGHTGRIEIIDRTNNNAILPTPFIDIGVVATGNEQGLTGLAFHPEYMTNGHPKEGHFYVCYNASGSGQTRIVEYQATGGNMNSNTASNTPVATILTVSQPASNHNGGDIHFGPDGKLYLSLGDGGGGGDTYGNGQNKNTILGAIARLDVDIPFPHTPADNPFVGVAGHDQVWMWGLRNPWRFTFDSLNGDIWIGDVGQNAHEEISYAPGTTNGGENFGWPCREGSNNYNSGQCSQAPFVEPVRNIQQNQGGNFSVISGYVYRGSIPGIYGSYFHADYYSSSIWTGTLNGAGTALTNIVDRESQLDPAAGSITSITAFAEDNDRELYVIEQGGQIWKIVEDCTEQATTYCVLSPNSFSNGAQIGFNGDLDLGLDNFNLTVQGATQNEFGLFVFGDGEAQVLNGDGTLCVGGSQIFRILPPVQTDFLGSALVNIDLAMPALGSGPIMPGTTYHWQFWYRDPGSPGGNDYNWSNGLKTNSCQ
jgi:glucose/arabinose dehydrogenase